MAVGVTFSAAPTGGSSKTLHAFFKQAPAAEPPASVPSTASRAGSAGCQPAESTQPAIQAAAGAAAAGQQPSECLAAGPQLPEPDAVPQPDSQRSSSSQLLQHALSAGSSQALTAQASGSGQLQSQLPGSARPPDPGGAAAAEASGDEDAALAARLQAEELQVLRWLVYVLMRAACWHCGTLAPPATASILLLQSCLHTRWSC